MNHVKGIVIWKCIINLTRNREKGESNDKGGEKKKEKKERKIRTEKKRQEQNQYPHDNQTIIILSSICNNDLFLNQAHNNTLISIKAFIFIYYKFITLITIKHYNH